MTVPAALTPEAIEAAFLEHGFVCTGRVATTLHLAERLFRDLAGLERGVAVLARRL